MTPSTHEPSRIPPERGEDGRVVVAMPLVIEVIAAIIEELERDDLR